MMTIISYIKNKFREYSAKRSQARFQAGYNYAMKAMWEEPNSQTISNLEAYVQLSLICHEFNEFDKGIEQAIEDWASFL